MTPTPTWWVDDRNPAIGEQLTIGGSAVDISNEDVMFYMRPVGSTALKVSGSVTTKDSSGNWTYAWQNGDLDTAGEYLVWLTVGSATSQQTMWESLIHVLAHGDEHTYIEVEQVKSARELQGSSYADDTLLMAVRAASRTVDFMTGRRFWADPDANQIRYYTPFSRRVIPIDDLVTLTSLDIDRAGVGSYTENWTAGKYQLEPVNATADSRPWEFLRARPSGGLTFPFVDSGVRVTGRFGWPTVPSDVQLATEILAVKYLLRVRDAPLGIMTVGLEGAMRLGRWDAELENLLGPYIKRKPFSV